MIADREKVQSPDSTPLASDGEVQRLGRVPRAGGQEMMDVLDVQTAGARLGGRDLETMEVLQMESVSSKQLRPLEGRLDGRPEFLDGLDGGEE